MLQVTRWKTLGVLGLCLVALLFASPNFFSKETVAGWPNWMPKKQVALGLDLRGGAHLLLELDSAEVRKDWLENLRDDARRRLRDAKIGFTGLGVTGNGVQIRLSDPAQRDAAVRELRAMAQPIGSAVFGSTGTDITVETGEAGAITVQPTDQGLQQRISNAVAAAIETVRRRIDTLGTAESSVVRSGADRILVQFPGLQDTTELKRLIGETARLSFHEVHADLYAEPGRPRPPGFRAFPGFEGGRADGQTYLLRETPVVRGDELSDAQPGFDQRTQEPIISFRFNQSGARKFGKFTQDNVGRPFAIVLDDKVISAPVIREPILGGTGQISGGFTVESATTLAIQLRSGALPAKLTIVEERTVGPSLGADSIEAGMTAFVIGCIATVIMVTIAYGTFGLFAVTGLLFNAAMIVSVMSVMGSTLTLPGIAGLVLTIGMAVDANVLIYERIREELRAGRTPVMAIEAGFDRAIVAILDSQLTTLAAAIIMFWLGSGPIRGFAVTLTIGIFTSVFTAVTVTRLFVALWLKSERARTKSISVPL
jgi:protein-export membrane protein SecD